MKLRFTVCIAALVFSLNAYSQFFDTVPFRGAFGLSGSTRPTTTSYNPDPTNTGADWTSPWANWTPNATTYPGDAGWTPTAQHPATNANKISVSGDISSDVTWTKNNWYEVSGTVHILNGVTLTIEPGTVIRGNANNVFVLIVAKGGKINAIGTKEQPIVFTSGKSAGNRVRGDWGGMLLIGNAHTNTANGVRQYEALPSDPLTLYGGGVNYNDADNSGTLRYIRIEYAGYNFLPDQEINGLTFAGVGNGTKADFIQVSYANDDSYEWFGGSSNHKYLIAFSGTDDDFDMDEGYNGKCQYLLGVRNPGVFETSPTGTSNGLEHDNNTGLGTAGQVTPGINAPEPRTAPVISNMTLLGPIRQGENRNSLSSTARARFGRSLEMRTNVSTSIFNSLIGGYPEGLRMVHPSVSIQPSVQERALADEMTMRANILSSAIPTDVLYSATNTPTGVTFNIGNWWFAGATAGLTVSDNDTANSVAKFGITTPGYTGTAGGSLTQIDFSGVNYTLSATSPYLAASRFNHSKIPTVPQPAISVNPTSLPVFNGIVGQPSIVKWVFMTAANLAGNITVTAPTGFEVSFSRTTGYATSINKNGPSANDSIFIRFTKTTPGSASGFIAITSSVAADFATINISVTGNLSAPASPFLGTNVAALSFTTPLSVTSAEQSFGITGKYLTGNATVTAPANFEVSTTSGSGFASTAVITPTAGGDVNTKVYVRYTAIATGSVSDSIEITAGGLDKVSVRVNGATPVATLTSSPAGYAEWQIVTGDSSAAYPFTVSGTNLTDSVKITAPNANFQLSTDSATFSSAVYLNTSEAATLASTKVYVRFKGATSTGSVTIASAGAASKTVAVAGRALSASAAIIWVKSATSSLSFETTFGTPSASQSVKVSAANLSDTVGAAFSIEGFEVSVDNNTWKKTLRLDTIADANGSVAETQVWIRYNPTVVGASGAQQLTINTPGATSVVLTVTGQSTPAVVVSPSVLPKFATVVNKASISIPVTVSGSRLLSNITLTPTAGFQVSLDSTTGFASSVSITKTGTTVAATKVYVRYNTSVAGNAPLNSALNVSTQSGPGAIIALDGYAVLAPTPSLTLSTAALTFSVSGTDPSSAQEFTVDALNLTDSLSIAVGGDFEFTNDTVAGTWKQSWKIGGDANGVIAGSKLYARFNRATNGTSTDSIVFTSAGLITQKIDVTGTKQSVGINEKGLTISSFNLYPNPANDLLHVSFDMKKSGVMSLMVYDITGKVVKEVVSNTHFSSGSTEITINVSELENGIYFVRISGDNGSRTNRLLIAK